MNEEEDNLSEEGLEDPYEKELREAQEQANQRNEEGFKDLTEGKIRRKRTGEDDEQLEIPFESRNLGRVGAGLAFEVGANTLLDALTLVPGSQAAGSAVINAIAQAIRGGKFSFGEVLGAAAASQIPGLAQGKAITRAGKLTRAVGEGALAGAIDATSIAAVDKGKAPTFQELGLAIGTGGILGAGFQQAGEGAGALLQQIRKKVQNNTPITVYAMSPQRAAIGAAPDPFKKGTPIKQQFGPYPQVPVNAEVKNAVDIDAAKDDIIATFGGKKTIRTPQGKGPLIYELAGGANVMFEVDLRGDSGIFRRDQLIAVPATDVALDSRKVLESVPEDLEYWIENKYGPEYLEQYKTWVKGGRDRLVDVKQEMQEAILSMRVKEAQREVRYSYPPGDPRTERLLAQFNTPQNQRLIKLDEAKLEDSHILSIGTKGKLTRVGLTEGVDRALRGSTVAGKKTPNVTRNFPKGSRVYDPPAAYQSFIEYWRLNRARGAGIALENVPEEEAIAQLRELGLPTSWLEDFINFALLDIGIRKELTNKDVVKLLKQGFSAEAVIEQRLRKLAREKANLDITDFAYKMQDLTPEEAIKAIDERYQREILAGTRPGDAFKE